MAKAWWIIITPFQNIYTRRKTKSNFLNLPSKIFAMGNLHYLVMGLSFAAGAIAHGGVVSYTIDGKEYGAYVSPSIP
jgi:hypothetical protein